MEKKLSAEDRSFLAFRKQLLRKYRPSDEDSDDNSDYFDFEKFNEHNRIHCRRHCRQSQALHRQIHSVGHLREVSTESDSENSGHESTNNGNVSVRNRNNIEDGKVESETKSEKIRAFIRKYFPSDEDSDDDSDYFDGFRALFREKHDEDTDSSMENDSSDEDFKISNEHNGMNMRHSRKSQARQIHSVRNLAEVSTESDSENSGHESTNNGNVSVRNGKNVEDGEVESETGNEKIVTLLRKLFPSDSADNSDYFDGFRALFREEHDEDTDSSMENESSDGKFEISNENNEINHCSRHRKSQTRQIHSVGNLEEASTESDSENSGHDSTNNGNVSVEKRNNTKDDEVDSDNKSGKIRAFLRKYLPSFEGRIRRTRNLEDYSTESDSENSGHERRNTEKFSVRNGKNIEDGKVESENENEKIIAFLRKYFSSDEDSDDDSDYFDGFRALFREEHDEDTDSSMENDSSDENFEIFNENNEINHCSRPYRKSQARQIHSEKNLEDCSTESDSENSGHESTNNGNGDEISDDDSDHFGLRALFGEENDEDRDSSTETDSSDEDLGIYCIRHAGKRHDREIHSVGNSEEVRRSENSGHESTNSGNVSVSNRNNVEDSGNNRDDGAIIQDDRADGDDSTDSWDDSSDSLDDSSDSLDDSTTDSWDDSSDTDNRSNRHPLLYL